MTKLEKDARRFEREKAREARHAVKQHKSRIACFIPLCRQLLTEGEKYQSLRADIARTIGQIETVLASSMASDADRNELQPLQAQLRTLLADLS